MLKPVLMLKVLLLLVAVAHGGATVLTLGTPHAPNMRHFGINDMFVDPFSYLNASAPGPPVPKAWANATSPYLSKPLTNAIAGLRVGAIRFPGGTIANFWNLSSSSLADNATMCSVSPTLCASWGWVASGLTAYPPAAFSIQHWSSLVANAEAALAATYHANPTVNTTWDLNIGLQGGPNGGIVAEIRSVHPGALFEMSNEVYDPHFRQWLPTVQQYVGQYKPVVAAIRDSASTAVVASPCPMFYALDSACWQPFYHAWNANLSAAVATTGLGVTAHAYPLNLDALDSFTSQPTSPSPLLAFAAFPEAAVTNAARRMATFFPNSTLHVTEANVFFPGAAGPPGGGYCGARHKSPPPPDVWQPSATSPNADFMRAAANGGPHAMHVAGLLMAAVSHGDVVGSMHYHGFLQGCAKKGCDPLAPQPGFGIVSLDDGLQVSAGGQVFAHLAHLARQATRVHAVEATGAPSLPAPALGVNLTAVQATAFSGASGTTVAVLLRQSEPLVVSVRNAGGSPLTFHDGLFYNATDPGGWFKFPPNTDLVSQGFPWAGPLKARTLPTGGTSVSLGLGFGLYLLTTV